MSDLSEALMPRVDEAANSRGLGPFVDNVIATLAEWQAQGLKTALLTLVNIEGVSPRPVGSQLAVNEFGESVGLISGGCVEAALVLEALSSITTQQVKLVRYGKDSDYMDIQLPCGSGIDVLFQPFKQATWVLELDQLLRKRQAVSWQFVAPDSVVLTPVLARAEELSISTQYNKLPRNQLQKSFTGFRKLFQPKQRLLVVGKGSVYDYFIQLMQVFDVEIYAYSSQYSQPACVGNTQTLPFASASAFNQNLLDAYTSVILLAHDHTWEIPILCHALASNAHYITALGSRNTHQMRLQLLSEQGVEYGSLSRIHGPAGLDIGSSTPAEIALSIVAQWVASLHTKPLS